MKKIIISIIIPIYNAQDYIDRCIMSIINQNYKNIEIIAINDGSTDDSLNVLYNFKERYDCLKVIDQKNSGVSVARNRGLDESSGEYVMFVDVDDFLLDDCISKMLNLALNNNADVVRSNYFFKNKSVLCFKNDHLYNLTSEDVKKELINMYISTNYFNNVWGQLVRKDVIGGNRFDPSLKMGEDFMFNLQLLSNVSRLYVTSICTYNYTYNVLGMNYNDSLDKIVTKIKNICFIYDYLYKRFDNKLVCKHYLKSITPHLLKINEYRYGEIFDYLCNQNIYISTIKTIRLFDMPFGKYYFCYLFVLKKKWKLLRVSYSLFFKPMKRIKGLFARRKK